MKIIFEVAIETRVQRIFSKRRLSPTVEAIAHKRPGFMKRLRQEAALKHNAASVERTAGAVWVLICVPLDEVQLGVEYRHRFAWHITEPLEHEVRIAARVQIRI